MTVRIRTDPTGLPADNISIKAPAKVNLYLKIVNKRGDGYHNLLSLMQMVGLYDLLTLEKRPSGIGLEVIGSTVPNDGSNLVHRAATLLQKEAGLVRGELPGVQITLLKKIPVAAGLGGGSSDAAATLIGLNRLWSLDWSFERLADLAAELGSDLPFFFYGPTAWVSGRGEKIEPIHPFFKGWIVLANPGIGVATAWVYEQLSKKMELTKEAPNITINPSLEEVLRQPYNDLEKVTLEAFPDLIQIKRELQALGGEGVLMSGSGPTLFARFSKHEAARKTVVSLKKKSSLQVWLAPVLTRPPF